MTGAVDIRRHAAVHGVVGTELFEAVGPDGAPVPGPRAALVGLIHGNEIVGEAVLTRLAPEVPARLTRGSLLLVRANLESQRLGRRHTPDGADMNRLWDQERLRGLADPGPDAPYEHRRVAELAPLLLACDAILDLHSTSRPAPPFLVFRDDARHAHVAARLGVSHLVTGLHEGAVLDGGVCPDVGLRPGERSPRLGFTFESGQHDDPTNLERAYDVACRFLHALGLWRDAPPAPEVRPVVYEVIDRFQQVGRGAVPYRFVGYEGGEPGRGRRGPPRKLASFDEIEADEVLLRRGRDTVVRAHGPFTMLLPTPNADPGTDLYYVCQRRPWRDPALGVRTDPEARIEAQGVERMLDLLDDDDFSRGTSRASFDARQALDLCADLVGRTLRLPADHPHRKVCVVGRGDWGGDEAERRAGHRYRHAMRRVLAAGVPIDRIQLLRGASLGWFRALTAPAMGALLEQRGRGELRLYLSARQPHTVSVLVVGDLDRALADGDLRHVRVALMVEAATVEPDGPVPRVRVARAGLVSARPEILGATSRLLTALRDEHRFLVRRDGPTERELSPLVGDDGAVRPSADALAALRAGLYRLQLRLWRDALRHELPLPRPVADDAELGHALAGLMVSTGILDAESLEALLVRRDGDRPVVDPGRIEDLLAEPDRPLPARRRVGRTIPQQPLVADDVDADAIERWLGWKRWLRTAQVVPDTRGKDVDLVFDERGIRQRAAAWLRHAMEQARRAPGRVMVVVAGDGLNPQQQQHKADGLELLRASREALQDPNLRYLRIQHAQGTTLSWLKGMIATLEQRPAGQPVAIQFEAAHGASVNVMLVCARDDDGPDEPWSLEGWRIERCSVLVSDLHGSGVRDSRIGLFTEPIPGPTPRVNQELLYFGRAHCQGLLLQGGPRIYGPAGAPSPEQFEAVVVDQVAGWLQRVRSQSGEAVVPPPDDAAARTRWVVGLLGLADEWLAERLAAEIDRLEPADAVARRLWAEAPARWPGAGYRSSGAGEPGPLPAGDGGEPVSERPLHE